MGHPLSMSSGAFVGFIIISLWLVIGFQIGQRRNLRYIKTISRVLEDTLRVRDKKYTLIGGVVGFHAEYRTGGFERVEAIVSLIPRQSLLYLPLVWLRGGYDRLDLIFYCKGSLSGEAHIIKGPTPRSRVPGIINQDKLKTGVVKIGTVEYELLYSSAESVTPLLEVVKEFPDVVHIAYTPEKMALYLRVRLDPGDIKRIRMLLERAILLCERD